MHRYASAPSDFLFCFFSSSSLFQIDRFHALRQAVNHTPDRPPAVSIYYLSTRYMYNHVSAALFLFDFKVFRSVSIRFHGDLFTHCKSKTKPTNYWIKSPLNASINLKFLLELWKCILIVRYHENHLAESV